VRPCGSANNLANSPTNVNFSNCRVGVIEDLAERRVANLPAETDLVLSPNPTDGLLNVRFWLAEAIIVQIEVQDLTGRVVKRFDFNAPQGLFLEKISLSDLPVGLHAAIANLPKTLRKEGDAAAIGTFLGGNSSLQEITTQNQSVCFQ